MSAERARLLLADPRDQITLIESPDRFARDVGMEVGRGLRGFLVSEDVAPEWVEALAKATGPDAWHFGFWVMAPDADRIIGTAGFKGPPDGAGMVEIAYGVLPDYEGRGYATDAASALVDWARSSRLVTTVRAHTLPESNASTSVLRKCGFQFQGAVEDPDDGEVWRWALNLGPPAASGT